MPLHKFIFLQACKLSAIFLLSLLFLPCLIFAFTFIFFSCFLLLPILCIFLSIIFFFSVAPRVSCRSIWNVFLRVCIWFLGAPNNDHKEPPLEYNTPVSVWFDPSEFPYFDESEDEDKVKNDGSNHEQSSWTSWCESNEEIINDSWQFPVLRTSKTIQESSFSDVMSFWKSKEMEGYRRDRLVSGRNL
ncbi:uncharacterized protein LOC122065257 [Macadamia integrifolia]|uniref:uncharacterized protein LOC122065257 n=1 Tax=Macadamia integrifolia TaxID=60698 RepID=UPI001C4E4383|nr:uncharacterized protein LOC122065257 [Macadamia integrifolia]